MVLYKCLNLEMVSQVQVRTLPRFGWAAAGMLLFVSAACSAHPSSTAAPAPSSGLPTVVPTKPTETKAIGLPIPGASALPSPENLQAAGRPPVHTKEKTPLPRPDHIVVVILENKHRSSVIGSRQATYLNKLAAKGANLTRSYGVTHPSQPNYLALFSGSTHGVRSNACPQHFRKPDNLGHQLNKAGLSFIGYSESLPKTGFRDVNRIATSASTTRGSTSACCRQPPTGLSAPSRATTTSCPLCRL